MDDIEHDQCHGEALVTPEGDCAIARKALAEGDPAHALFHVAGALAVKPREPAYLELLEEVLASVSDALVLTAREGGDWFALFAMRAYALRRAGRSTDALDLLLRVLEARPDSAFEAWLADWIASDAYDPSLLARFYDRTLSGVEETDLGRRYGDHLRARLLEILAVARERHPDDAPLARTHARLLRVLRRFDEALAIAGAVEAREPSYESALLLGTIHRERGALEEGVRWFVRAAERRDEDWAIRLDIGDSYLDLQRWDDAIEAYEAALARRSRKRLGRRLDPLRTLSQDRRARGPRGDRGARASEPEREPRPVARGTGDAVRRIPARSARGVHRRRGAALGGEDHVRAP
ncbi:MAG: tetratricopeptide repeat protein [Sandaracinaceae bacterium]|nr:tetratricopeptide repeat protein [Sandaracinaceae bacterium]